MTNHTNYLVVLIVMFIVSVVRVKIIFTNLIRIEFMLFPLKKIVFCVLGTMISIGGIECINKDDLDI